jgi:hypothetical protein
MSIIPVAGRIFSRRMQKKGKDTWYTPSALATFPRFLLRR